MLVLTSFLRITEEMQKDPDRKRDSAISFPSGPIFQPTKKPPYEGGHLQCAFFSVFILP